jgi:hypothetical protein
MIVGDVLKCNFQYAYCNAPTEALRRQYLPHPSDGLQSASPTNNKNNKEIKWSQLTKLNNRLFNDTVSL